MVEVLMNNLNRKAIEGVLVLHHPQKDFGCFRSVAFERVPRPFPFCFHPLADCLEIILGADYIPGTRQLCDLIAIMPIRKLSRLTGRWGAQYMVIL